MRQGKPAEIYPQYYKMKIKIVTDYNTTKQEEVLVEAQLNHFQIDKIVQSFFYNMDYHERRAWIKKNMKKEHIKEIRSIV